MTRFLTAFWLLKSSGDQSSQSGEFSLKILNLVGSKLRISLCFSSSLASSGKGCKQLFERNRGNGQGGCLWQSQDFRAMSWMGHGSEARGYLSIKRRSIPHTNQITWTLWYRQLTKFLKGEQSPSCLTKPVLDESSLPPCSQAIEKKCIALKG